MDSSNKMQRYHSNSIRCLFLLLDTHPRAAPVIGRALFWCHRGGNRMMGILTHERKRQRRLWLAASRGPHSGSREIHSEPRLPLDGPHVRLEEAGGSGRLFLFFSPFFFFGFFFFPLCLGTGAERGPAGYAAAVGLHPRVWRLGSRWRPRGRRRQARDGERETKRRKFLQPSVDTASSVRCFSSTRPPAWKRCACTSL